MDFWKLYEILENYKRAKVIKLNSMTIFQNLKKIKPSIKKDWLDNNTDLIENGILDSFEMLEFILLLEKYNFNYDQYIKNIIILKLMI